MERLRLGIIGHGFVGGAIDTGFALNVDKFIVDPKYDTTIDQLMEFQPNIVFVAVPTPMNYETGEIDPKILATVVHDLYDRKYTGTLVIKSTVTPDHLESYLKYFPGLVYNPEFLTERNANVDFINPPMHIIGTKWFSSFTDTVYAYQQHSLCKECPIISVTPQEASLIKYTINSFLSVKVTFFNEINRLYNAMGLKDFETFTDILKLDERMGQTHMNVPGPDGKPGFGGTCFPKDTNALIKFGEKKGSKLPLLFSAVLENEIDRPEYMVKGSPQIPSWLMKGK